MVFVYAELKHAVREQNQWQWLGDQLASVRCCCEIHRYFYDTSQYCFPYWFL